MSKIRVYFFGVDGLKLKEQYGKNDPYCILTVTGFEPQKLMSDPSEFEKPKESKITWNQELFVWTPNLSTAEMKLELFEILKSEEEKLIGSTSHSLKNLVLDKEIKQFLEIKNGNEVTGKVYLALTLISTSITQYTADQLDRKYPHIARGSFGIVYKGKVPDITQTVVIKDMKLTDSKSLEDWKNEIDLMRKIKSRYIMEVFGFCVTDELLTIVMEFMVNGDLYTVLHTKRDTIPLSLLQKMRMARHAVLGVQVLHSNKILHRDIKSMNILVAEDYTCKLTDFGCAKLQKPEMIINTLNSGTPLWMAPEVKLGNTYTYTADIYSLGLVLYEILERKLPHYNQQKQTVELPPYYESKTVVEPCIKHNPNDRCSIDIILKKCETLLTNTVKHLKQNLSLTEKTELLQRFRKQQSDDVEENDVFLYFLERDAKEVDSLIHRAFPPSNQSKSNIQNISQPTRQSIFPNQPQTGFPNQNFQSGQTLQIPYMQSQNRFTPSNLPHSQNL